MSGRHGSISGICSKAIPEGEERLDFRAALDFLLSA